MYPMNYSNSNKISDIWFTPNLDKVNSKSHSICTIFDDRVWILNTGKIYIIYFHVIYLHFLFDSFFHSDNQIMSFEKLISNRKSLKFLFQIYVMWIMKLWQRYFCYGCVFTTLFWLVIFWILPVDKEGTSNIYQTPHQIQSSKRYGDIVWFLIFYYDHIMLWVCCY